MAGPEPTRQDGTGPDGLDCDQLVELVTEFLEGALDAPTERRLVDHLALCDGCGTYLEQIRATVRALGDLPSGHLPGRARAALLSAFRAGDLRGGLEID